MSDSKTLVLMTFNLRGYHYDDGDLSWDHRKERVIDVINRHQPAIVGTQENEPPQIHYMAEKLAPHYKWFGVCRDPDNPKDDHVAVFYDTRRLKLEKHGDFWLSETPDVAGSKSWDSYFPRIVSWGKLRRVTPSGGSNDVFYLLNTHLEYHSSEARIQGAAVVLKKMHEIVDSDVDAEGRHHLAFFMGDFNSTRTEQPWQVLTGEIEFNDQRGNMVDLWQIAEKRVNDVYETRHDFKGCHKFDEEGPGHIDFIFYRPSSEGREKDGLKVSDATVVIDGNDDGKYPSDHFPICATVSF